jgi:ribose transport system ATP-binding protein
MSVLQIDDLTKIYPGTIALNHVSCTFQSGEVHAIVGKNGSGKSTLVKAISGAITTDSGTISLDNQKLNFSGPADAYQKGIATVYQELSLVPSLNIAENIFMGRLIQNGRFINWNDVYQRTEKLLKNINIDLSPKTPVYRLHMWQRQMVEIAKAISRDAKVLMLDEPTSALSLEESNLLFRFIRELKKKDIVILYITHRLHELWEIADKCTVLKDGEKVGELEMEKVSHKDVINLMFGEVDIRTRPHDLYKSDEIVMEIKNLTRKNCFENISFHLKKGEVLGIAGMLGSGRTELLSAIFGAMPFDSGKIFIKGKEHSKILPRVMKKNGLAMTQEDRKNKGLIQIHSVKSNLSLASLERMTKAGFISSSMENQSVNRQIADLDIKTSSPNERVSSLSGGNQQKVVVGNWLNNQPEIILFDEPSRGIDVNAKQQIFQIIWEQSKKGISSVMVSSELEELIEVCQRILIMRHGKIIDEVYSDNLTVDELYLKCMEG